MRSLKILIVDDEPLNISLYFEMLRQDDYNIIAASDGIEAIQKAESEMPDLIILDWNMPRLNGLEALKKIKTAEQTNIIPVLMITGVMTSSENLMSALHEGAIDFLRKPFDRMELKARVRSALLLSQTIRSLDDKYNIIRDRNKFIHSLIESLPHPLAFYTLDGMILGCNRMFEQITGKSEEELKHKLIYRQFNAENSTIHLNADIILINSKENSRYEIKLKDHDLDFIVSKNLFFNTSGEPEGILCILTDVTEINKAHKQIMENKKKELVSSALRLIQISELNNNLISELAKINPFVNKQANEMIRQIIKLFNASTGEKIWEDFLNRFENVYEKFHKRLQEEFPDLSPGEQKLCALLRLNISTKDIAAITFQNPQSIDTARYRLRKKLNLDPDENLVDFLLRLDS